MTKTQLIVSTKNQHTRLKNNVSGLRDLVHAGYQQRHLKRLNRLQQRWESQLTDELGQPLLQALTQFKRAYQADITEDVQAAYTNLMQALWTYRTEHWQAIEAKYGKVSHYLDGFGQVKPHYTERARCADEKAKQEEANTQTKPWHYRSFWLGMVLIMLLSYWLVIE